MNALTWIAPTIVIFVVVGIPAIALIVQVRRARTQRIAVKNGVLFISDGVSGTLQRMPVDDIGAVVHLVEQHPVGRVRANGIWTWGGLLILNRQGRVVRHAVAIPGTEVPWSTIFQSIPAPVRQEFTSYTRRSFLRAFPHALRFGQLWGATRWAVTIVAFIFVGIPVLVVLGVFVWAFAQALTST